jgi:hypothetical protein
VLRIGIELDPDLPFNINVDPDQEGQTNADPYGSGSKLDLSLKSQRFEFLTEKLTLSTGS